MRQLSLEHFQKPQKGENQLLETTDREFRSIPATITQTSSAVEVDPSPIPQTPIALRPFTSTPEVKAPSIRNHQELICVLSQNLPLNEYRLPTHIYRPDLLDPRMFNDVQEGDYQKTLAFLEAAEVKVAYHEGYPSISATPLWFQLPWESGEDYQLFTQYLELPGARQLHLLKDGGRAAALFHTNYWSFRVQASDSFAVAHYQRMRQQRILSTDNKHFLEAEKLFSQLSAMAPQVNWDALKEEPDKFVKVLNQVVEIQRRALGVNLKAEEPQKAAQPVELIMRNLVREPVDPNAPVDVTKTITPEGEEIDIREILRKAPDIKSLQELVLKVGR